LILSQRCFGERRSVGDIEPDDGDPRVCAREGLQGGKIASARGAILVVLPKQKEANPSGQVSVADGPSSKEVAAVELGNRERLDDYSERLRVGDRTSRRPYGRTMAGGARRWRLVSGGPFAQRVIDPAHAGCERKREGESQPAPTLPVACFLDHRLHAVTTVGGETMDDYGHGSDLWSMELS